jgi:hypothetical protein
VLFACACCSLALRMHARCACAHARHAARSARLRRLRQRARCARHRRATSKGTFRARAHAAAPARRWPAASWTRTAT